MRQMLPQEARAVSELDRIGRIGRLGPERRATHEPSWRATAGVSAAPPAAVNALLSRG